MRSCIDGVSVKQERQLFAELRRRDFDADVTTLLSNGMSVQDFALRYVLGNRMKRHRSAAASHVRAEPENVPSDHDDAAAGSPHGDDAAADQRA